MPEIATAWVTLTASTRGMEGDVKRALERVDGRGAGRKAGKQFSDGMANETRGLGRKIGDFFDPSIAMGKVGRTAGLALKGAVLGGVAGIGATIAGTVGVALTKGFQRLRTIDDAKFKLKALGNSAGDVQKIMDSALEAVKGTAFGLGDAATIAANAVAAGVKPGEELTKYLKMTADASAIAGTELSDMGRIINQVRTGQKAYTEDLNQLADRGIPIYQWLAEETGVAAGEVKKLAADGKIDAATFEAAIQKHIGGAALTMGQSFSGAVDNAEAALGRLGAAFLKPVFGNAAGGLGSVTTGLDGITNWIDTHQGTIIGFWETLGDAAITGAENFAHGVGGALQALGDLAGGIGNVKGFLDDSMAFFADLRGDEVGAEAFRRSADEAYGWGESIRAAGDKLANLNLDSTREKLHSWADAARDADTAARNATTGGIAGLGAALGALPDSKKIDVTLNTAEAEKKWNDFKNMLQNPPTPTVNVRPGSDALSPDFFTPPTGGRAGGRATGGAIFGPGGPTSDVIPMWASNGEHVLTASDVKAMGGQGGVYAFRNALHRAGGGAVGDNVDAMFALAQAASGKTAYAPASDLINGLADCSGSISDLVEILQTGKTTSGRLFTTTNFASDAEAAKLGFLPGYMPGALNVGVNPYPGQSGHMAATLPNGVNFEGGGGTGGGAQYGGSAAGALDPQFKKRYYLPIGQKIAQDYADGLTEGGQTAAEQIQDQGPTSGGMDGSSLGQSIISGLLQGLGFDGSVFSNPLEWPNVKSGIALANWGGGLLKSALSSGQEGGPTTSFAGGGGGPSIGGFGSLPNVVDFIKPLNQAPNVPGSPGYTGPTGPAPGPLVQYNGPVNMGVDPRAMTQRQDAHMNQAWRKNMTSVRPA